jgi:amphi-Trp domain-containing protein
MAKEIVLFKSEERKSLTEVAAFLRELADRLDSNQVTLRQGAEELTLSIPDQVVLEIKVEDEGTKHSLEVEIEWKDGDDAAGGVTLG